MENDGPYQTERQLWIAIDDIFSADINQFDLKLLFFENVIDCIIELLLIKLPCGSADSRVKSGHFATCGNAFDLFHGAEIII